jgi:hypothetical protein
MAARRKFGLRIENIVNALTPLPNLGLLGLLVENLGALDDGGSIFRTGGGVVIHFYNSIFLFFCHWK